jgi:hypothetical protein
VGVGEVGEKVAELLVEPVVAIIADLEDAVLDSEGVGVVFTEGPFGDFDGPA